MNLQNRRDFVKLGLMSSLSIPFINCSSNKNSTPKISIVGGGIAGLYAAYILKKVGILAQVYEAQSRVGGRIVTGKDIVAKGITTEMGGEFIDSSHKELLDLCKEFNLPLLDMLSPSEHKLVKTDYFINGHRRKNTEIIDGFKNYPQILKDMEAIEKGDKKRYSELDKFTIDEYLHSIGMSGWLSDLLKVSFTSELGLESSIQNCITMLTMISIDLKDNNFEIYGDSDERFKVLGGNERIIEELSKRVENLINTDFVLLEIKQLPNKKYRLIFNNGKVEESDILIITMPFTALRNVKLNFEMPALKRKCIDELKYGTQSKLFLGVKERFWRNENYSGYVLSDIIHNGWDSSQMQLNNKGVGSYTVFLGGDKGLKLDASQKDFYLENLENIYSGANENFLSHNVYNWTQNPFIGGAYSCYLPNQMTSIAGWEGKPVGNVYFAGEHCSKDYGGYMYGAIETAQKVVSGILKK